MASDAPTVWTILGSVGAAVGGLSSAVAAVFSARSASSSRAAARDALKSLALHFQPSVVLEVGPASTGVSNRGELPNEVRRRLIGSDVQISLRMPGGPVALMNDRVSVQWAGSGFVRRGIVVLRADQQLVADAAVLTLQGVPIEAFDQLGQPIVSSLHQLQLHVQDAATASSWVGDVPPTATGALRERWHMTFALEQPGR